MLEVSNWGFSLLIKKLVRSCESFLRENIIWWKEEEARARTYGEHPLKELWRIFAGKIKVKGRITFNKGLCMKGMVDESLTSNRDNDCDNFYVCSWGVIFSWLYWCEFCVNWCSKFYIMYICVFSTIVAMVKVLEMWIDDELMN